MIRPLILLSGIALLVGLFVGCGPAKTPAFEKLPPLPAYPPGLFVDVNPRWSHTGREIAFLRSSIRTISHEVLWYTGRLRELKEALP